MARLTVLRWLTAVTVAASVLTVAGPVQAGTGASLHISVGLTPSTARVGSVVLVSGTVSSHQAAVPLVLQRLVSKHWISIGRVKTTASGRYAIHVRAPEKAATWALRVTRTASASSPATHLRAVKTSFAVRASAPPSVASGVPVAVTGSVAPKTTGSVWLQQFSAGTWHNLVSAKLAKSSVFRMTRTLPTGAYQLRVVKAFSTTVAEGHSAALKVIVAAPVPMTPAPPALAPLAVATAALPAATMGRTYTVTLGASGGTPPYTWGVTSSLPAGVSLSSAGALTGFPTAAGSSAVTVVVVDGAGASTTRTLVLSVGASPAAGRTIRAWGGGPLGNGTNTGSSTPVQVQQLTGVVAAAGTNGAAYGLLDDGTVWAWGRNNYGQLGDGTATDSTVPVQVVGVSGITALATTNFGGLALRYDGTVWAWGVGVEGQLGNGTYAPTSTAVQVTRLAGAVAIAGASATGYALKSDGTVWAWGEGLYGELGNGGSAKVNLPVRVSLVSKVTAIAAGADSGYARKSDGTVWSWGENGRGQLGDSTMTRRLTPVQVFGLTGVKTLAGNLWNGYALKSDGTVWSWGYNTNGQLGNGSGSTESDVPVRVSGLIGVAAITAGVLTGYARLSDGTVSAWGYNAGGQLGNGTSVTADSNVPVPVSSLSGVRSIAGGAIAYGIYAVV